MFQVFATLFFSASALVALAVIVGMLFDNMADIRAALGIDDRRFTLRSMPHQRRVSRGRDIRTRSMPAPAQRAAA